MMKNLRCLFLVLVTISFSQITFSQQQYKVGITGFYNVENLFDTIQDPTIKDEEFIPTGSKVWNSTKYNEKLNNLARVISEIGLEYSPDGVAVLGLSEVENRRVIQDLVVQSEIKDRNYEIVHEDSPDERGIDVALIYNPKYFKYEGHTAIELPLEDNDGEADYTRDILHVWGQFDGDTFHYLVNHWPSRSGGEAATTQKRQKGAKICRKITDSLMNVNPMAKVIIMGDLNDDPVSTSVDKVLNAKGKKRKVKEGDLYNPYYNFFKDGIGTGAYRDSWNLFDQVILSYGLVESDQVGYRLYKAGIYNKDYLIQKTGNFKGYPFRTFGGDHYQGGYSDHFAVYCVLVKAVH